MNTKPQEHQTTGTPKKSIHHNEDFMDIQNGKWNYNIEEHEGKHILTIGTGPFEKGMFLKTIHYSNSTDLCPIVLVLEIKKVKEKMKILVEPVRKSKALELGLIFIADAGRAPIYYTNI